MEMAAQKSKFDGVLPTRTNGRNGNDHQEPISRGISGRQTERPIGKRSDSTHYKQRSAYIHNDVFKKFKKKMLEQDEEEISDLVERLMLAWVENPNIING